MDNGFSRPFQGHTDPTPSPSDQKFGKIQFNDKKYELFAYEKRTASSIFISRGPERPFSLFF
jgi:hypothetical protein